MMPTIRINDDVYEGLKKLAVPFEDTPNDVISRLLRDKGILPTKNISENISSNPQKIPEEKKGDEGIRFPFLVNKSFLDQTNHPITIPTKYHEQMKSFGITKGILSFKDRIQIVVTNHHSKLFDGKLYHNFGSSPYYQILIPKKNASGYCEGLKIGDQITVILQKNNSNPTATLIAGIK